MLLQYLRHAFRSLFAQPSFAWVAIAMLALGIGATTAMFTVVKAVLLTPLRLDAADQLVMLYEHNRPSGRIRNTVAPAEYLNWRTHATGFERMGAFTPQTITLLEGGQPERVAAGAISTDFLGVIRARPLAGRLFNAGDEQSGAAGVAIISDALWARRFGQDPNVVGRRILINDQPTQIVGVLEDRFFSMTSSFQSITRIATQSGPEQLWIPLTLSSGTTASRTSHGLRVLARLKAGTSIARVRGEMDALVAAMEAAGESLPGHGVTVLPLFDEIVGAARTVLTILLTSVVLVLIIASVNVANLLLARGTRREQEIATRRALGASRAQILEQVLVESLLLAAIGAAAGVALAGLGLEVLVALGDGIIPRADEIALDAQVLGVTAATAICAAVASGLYPAIACATADLAPALRASANGAGGSGSAQRRVRRALVIGEIAVGMVVLAATSVVILSFVRVLRVETGFESEGVTSMSLSLSGLRYADANRRVSFVDEVVTRIAAIPGVEGVSVAASSPARGSVGMYAVRIEGRPAPHEGGTFDIRYNRTGVGYFALLRIPLRQGRDFDWRDVSGAAEVVIVNEEMVRVLFGGTSPLGTRVDLGRGRWKTIVGVVANSSRLDATIRPEVFEPYRQNPWSSATVLVRSSARVKSLAATMIESIRSVDPTVAVHDVTTLDGAMHRTVAGRRFNAALLAAFGVLAIGLVSVGLYAVMSHTVAARSHELGVRLAVGASPQQLIALVLREGMALAGSGVVIGLCLSLAVTGSLRSLLFGLSARDPIAMAAAAVLMLVLSAGACTIPARRAGAVDPLHSLR